MKKYISVLCICLLPTVVWCHFQVLVPSTDFVVSDGDRTVKLDVLFTHPMANGPVMNMGPVSQFGVMHNGKKHDLKDTLEKKVINRATTYTCKYTINRPGDHVFYIEPSPYWEPSEQKMIVHYTKVVVDGMARGGQWDTMVGFPVEIRPLVCPYSLWTGNSFRGVVVKNGKPVPFAEIEVEYLNTDNKVVPPSDAYVTQVIKADATGTFCYTMPRAGWWAFAALIDGDNKMKNSEGKEVDVELGALMWVKTRDMK